MSFVMAAVATSCGQGEGGGSRRIKEGQDFKLFHPKGLLRAPSNWNTKLPLSDQRDSGRWSLISALSDEFTGSELDKAKWNTTNPRWGGRPPGFRSPDNVYVKDGELQLVVRKEEPPAGVKNREKYDFTCGMIRSVKTQKYGYYEVRAKAARSIVNSAFWLYKNEGESWTELDVFEIGGTSPRFKNKIHVSAHVFRTRDSDEHKVWPGLVNIDEDPTTSYHVYGLEWTPETLNYYFDGQLIRSGKNDHWHDDLNVIVSTGISDKWFGIPSSSELPATFYVDYVRSWSKR
ncbi:MAG TPA: family 16 glycosylhydrolase [Fimbriimonas sp.]|nr:family 16 glycosylhydrolase [Fimbriimonas sp.]